MSITELSILQPLSVMTQLKQKVKECDDLKRKYLKSLSEASGEDVFKILLLINIVTCDGYATQTQVQAQQSFRLSKWVAIAGFFLLAGGVAAGLFTQMIGQPRLEVVYLSAIAGLITEFISGIFFYLYNKTLRQINLFHNQLQVAQKIAMGLFLNGLIKDQNQKDTDRLEIIKLLLLYQEGTDQNKNTRAANAT